MTNALQACLLVFVCVLIAFGPAAAFIVDAMDGDDDAVPGCELSALLFEVPGLLPSPAPAVHVPGSRPPEGSPRADAPAPPSLRAPPAL